jgi:hypothetical protein
VPERRQGIAGLRIGILLVEGGDQRPHREGRGEILDGLRATDPFAQLFQRHWQIPPICLRLCHCKREVERLGPRRYIPAQRAKPERP